MAALIAETTVAAVEAVARAADTKRTTCTAGKLKTAGQREKIAASGKI